MHLNAYYPVDVVNGPGTRCTLFVSGCEHQCKGCYNQSTWRADSGILFTSEIEDQIIADLNCTRIRRQGLSLSGGDPLHPANLDAVLHLLNRVRNECQGKDVWCWTGYRFGQLTTEQQLVTNLIDVLIDGKFEQALASPELPWRGSSNQQVITLNCTK
ncbi:anaerobic ribonucleoside-triphosphate reductase-activating protein [Corallincola spongiicola]|uniref:Anaerobic ribonucleoside-triphosphate reductase-activating protein n=1 Tax=Corallincola spongiicola TaxID=2520508 RepID=A0ABY1WRS2_9GAMM|nr:anaerobic ribonucleoside-triphosphate reductase-activating protein [Corallincola spongiicola]TAA47423.1 anaerobic ribonucleoside-triphosphate reductase-activating protein [Corallincola spongiicola]